MAKYPKSEGTKKIRKLQKGKIWPSIILFLISLMIGAIVVLLEVSLFIAYVFEEKVDLNERQVATYAEGISQKKQEGMDYAGILSRYEDIAGNPEAMFIFDKDGTELASYGENTIGQNGAVDLDALAEDEISTSFFIDQESDVMLELEDGAVLPSGEEIANQILANALEYLFDNKEAESDGTIYRVKYWRGNPIADTSDKVIIKCDLEIRNTDLYGGIMIAIMSVILFVILFTLQFINVISAIGAQRRMAKVLLIDTVTGGANWTAFVERVYKLLTAYRNRQTTFALVDVSLLKYQAYCSLHGVEEGEELLLQIDQYLKRWNKRNDVHARVSGGDFALLLKVPEGEGGREMITECVGSLLAEMSSGLVHKHGKKGEYAHADSNCSSVNFRAGIFFVAPSFLLGGRTVSRRSYVDVERFYINAGMAKASLLDGEEKTVAIYNDEMLKAQLWQHKVEDRMQGALDREEFQVYVQPKYDPVTEQLVGGEALVRWLSGEDGMIPPGKFIPIFEQTGFVTKLDDYMISHVAKLQADWLKKGKKIVPISVNVSRAHFAQENLAEHIRNLVDVYEVPHEYVEIELTESAFFDDKKALLTTVKKLQEYGFDVSMDDFGSGYSSLNSLKDLPLNVLKLDAEFFRGDDFDTRGEIVVSEAISLAKQLNMRIVAEGVEKKEQVDFLAKQQCDMIQGYYFAKPMPADEYEQRMSEV